MTALMGSWHDDEKGRWSRAGPPRIHREGRAANFETDAPQEGPSAAVRTADPHDVGIASVEAIVIRRAISVRRSEKLSSGRQPEQWKGFPILPRRRRRSRHEIDKIGAALVP